MNYISKSTGFVYRRYFIRFVPFYIAVTGIETIRADVLNAPEATDCTL